MIIPIYFAHLQSDFLRYIIRIRAISYILNKKWKIKSSDVFLGITTIDTTITPYNWFHSSLQYF